MRYMMLVALTMLAAGAALAQDSTGADGDKSNTDPAKDKAESETAATAKQQDKLVIPPGFKVKKRGEIVLYCIRGKATGTRFQTESCYDEAQLHDYLLAREQNNRDFERSRGVCSNPATCGSP